MLQKVKLVISEIVHKQNFLHSPFKNGSMEQSIFYSLKKDGCAMIDSFISEEMCDELRSKAESFLQENQEKVVEESKGSDKRVYGIDKYTKNFNVKECLELSNKLFDKFSFVINRDHLVLLGKISASEENLGSGSGWHRDSPFSHQFKTILYLSDVTEQNGPFEFIKGSHKYRAIKEYTKEINVPLNKYRFSNEEIENLVKKGRLNEPTKFIAKAGSLLFADVRGLHRGVPLKSGERYALTNYHFTNKRSSYYA